MFCHLFLDFIYICKQILCIRLINVITFDLCTFYLGNQKPIWLMYLYIYC